MGISLSPPLLRVFRARSEESIGEAREGRAELVTFDSADLVRVVSRCKTTLSPSEVASVKRAAPDIAAGTDTDIVLAPGGRVVVLTRGR